MHMIPQEHPITIIMPVTATTDGTPHGLQLSLIPMQEEMEEADLIIYAILLDLWLRQEHQIGDGHTEVLTQRIVNYFQSALARNDLNAVASICNGNTRVTFFGLLCRFVESKLRVLNEQLIGTTIDSYVIFCGPSN